MKTPGQLDIEAEMRLLEARAWRIVRRTIKGVCDKNGWSFRANCLWGDRYTIRDESNQKVDSKEIHDVVYWYVDVMGGFRDFEYSKGKWT